MNSELVALAPLPNKAKYNPAFVLYAVNTVVAALVTWGLPLSNTTTAAISAVATAVLGLIAAWAVRPFAVGAATAVVAALGQLAISLGFHLTQDKITGLAALVSLVAAFITHQTGTPQQAVKDGLRAAA